MENNQENISPIIQPQPPKRWGKKLIILIIVALVGLASVYIFYPKNIISCGVWSDGSYCKKYVCWGIIPMQGFESPVCLGKLKLVGPTTSPQQQHQAQDAFKNWQTYKNQKYGFEFKYPQDWSLTDLYNNLLLKNIDGKEVIQISLSLRTLNYDYESNLENYIKSRAGQENSRAGEDVPENIEKMFFEKIIDDSETLGYISQWKIIWRDKTSEIETRADFESKLEQPQLGINSLNKYKTVSSLFVIGTQQNLNKLDLLKSIASSFEFTKLKQIDLKKLVISAPDSLEWCIANGGDDRTPNYNAPKKCILENRVYEENCVSNTKYFVIENNLTDSIGANHLVKFKTNENQNFDCKYVVENGDFEIKNEWAEYTLALENNFLILDSGTGPDLRGLIIYNLNSRQKVYTDEYFEPVLIQNNIINYWSPTNQKATNENCPKLNEYLSGGLGAEIDSHVILDLFTLFKKELGEYRCSPRQ